MNDQASNSQNTQSWWSRHFVKVLLGGVAVVAAIYYLLTVPDVPPGPRPDRLELKKPGTVIIRVQPDHRDRMQGAVFVIYPEPKGESEASHTIIDVPEGRSPMPGFPYTLILDATKHLKPMTDEIATSDPHLVDLEFYFDPLVPTELYALLLAAQKADPRVQFTVTNYCWYIYDKKYDQSVNPATLRVNVEN